MYVKRLAATICLALPLAALADGDVVFDLRANAWDRGFALASGPSGRLYFTSEDLLVAVDANGQRIPNYGSNGVVVVGAGVDGPLAVRPDGSVLTGNSAFVSLDPAGVRVNSSAPPCADCINSIALLPDGRAYLGGTRFTAVSHRPDNWILSRLTPDGSLDATFGTNGIADKDGAPSPQISTLRVLLDDQLLAYGDAGDSAGTITTLGRFNSDGSVDFSFGTNGVVALGLSSWGGNRSRSDLSIDQSGRLLVPGGTDVLRRFNSNGTADNSYSVEPADPAITYHGFVLDSQDRAIVYGQRGDQAYVARLLPDGGFDNSFGVAGETLPAPNLAGITGVEIAQAIVDATDRPVLLTSIQRQGLGQDIALLRLTT